MNKVKKTIAMLAVFICLICMLSFFTNAVEEPDPIKSVLRSCLVSEDFNEKWKKTVSVYIGSTKIGEMEYGFDTFLFNEDYANTKGSGKRSMAALWRSGYDENPTKADIENSGVWSECSLRHKVYYVYYYGNFYN